MKCASCESKIPEGAKYCPGCGLKAPVAGGGLSREDTVSAFREVLIEAGLMKPKADPKPKEGEADDDDPDDPDDPKTFRA